MAIDFADVDRDGLFDMLQVDMLSRDTRRLRTQIPTHTALPKVPGVIEDRPQMQRNTLFLNRGDGSYAQVAEFANVDASGWSWSALFADIDLDGWEDILIGTGHPWDLMDADTQERLRNRLSDVDWRRQRWLYPALKLPNVALRNNGDLTFTDVSTTWRFGLEDDISHGMATADLDGDGDQDVVINRLDSPALVMRNDATAPRVLVRLKAEGPNTRAVGALIHVLRGPVADQIARGNRRRTLPLPFRLRAELRHRNTPIRSAIVVDWPDGQTSRPPGARAGREYEVTPASATAGRPRDSLGAAGRRASAIRGPERPDRASSRRRPLRRLVAPAPAPAEPRLPRPGHHLVRHRPGRRRRPFHRVGTGGRCGLVPQRQRPLHARHHRSPRRAR